MQLPRAHGAISNLLLLPVQDSKKKGIKKDLKMMQKAENQQRATFKKLPANVWHVCLKIANDESVIKIVSPLIFLAE